MLQKKENNLFNQIGKICLILINAIVIITIIIVMINIIIKNEEVANKYAIICYYALFIDAIFYSFFILVSKK